MDLGDGLAILGASKTLEKFLGPTAAYLGDNLKLFSEKQIKNLGLVFQNALKKTKTNSDDSSFVSPKVLKEIVNNGIWCDNQLQREYLGGILASSKTTVRYDDRGAYYINLVSRLSNYQIKTHYILYTAIKNNSEKKKINSNNIKSLKRLKTFIPYEEYIKSMDLSDKEEGNWYNLLSHSMWGLNNEQLIIDFFWGRKKFLWSRDLIKEKVIASEKKDGIIYSPTSLGVELYMWTFGFGKCNSSLFFGDKLDFQKIPNFHIPKAKSL